MSDLDDLMYKDPLELSAQDIDAIIAYHRNIRAKKAAGEKPTKPAAVDISSILSKIKTTNAPKVTRRV